MSVKEALKRSEKISDATPSARSGVRLVVKQERPALQVSREADRLLRTDDSALSHDE